MVSIFQENFAHLASQQFHLALYPSFVTDCLLFFLFVVGLFCCLFVYKMLVQGGSNTRGCFPLHLTQLLLHHSTFQFSLQTQFAVFLSSCIPKRYCIPLCFPSPLLEPTLFFHSSTTLQKLSYSGKHWSMFAFTTRVLCTGMEGGGIESELLFNPLNFLIDEFQCQQAQVSKPFMHI